VTRNQPEGRMIHNIEDGDRSHHECGLLEGLRRLICPKLVVMMEGVDQGVDAHDPMTLRCPSVSKQLALRPVIDHLNQ
jgi:hypothetical protein